jgi:hypothetical protein
MTSSPASGCPENNLRLSDSARSGTCRKVAGSGSGSDPAAVVRTECLASHEIRTVADLARDAADRRIDRHAGLIGQQVHQVAQLAQPIGPVRRDAVRAPTTFGDRVRAGGQASEGGLQLQQDGRSGRMSFCAVGGRGHLGL